MCKIWRPMTRPESVDILFIRWCIWEREYEQDFVFKFVSLSLSPSFHERRAIEARFPPLFSLSTFSFKLGYSESIRSTRLSCTTLSHSTERVTFTSFPSLEKCVISPPIYYPARISPQGGSTEGTSDTSSYTHSAIVRTRDRRDETWNVHNGVNLLLPSDRSSGIWIDVSPLGLRIFISLKLNKKEKKHSCPLWKIKDSFFFLCITANSSSSQKSFWLSQLEATTSQEKRSWH